MPSASLIHDVAWATATDLFQLFAPCLLEEDKHDAFAQLYLVVKAGLEFYQTRENHRQYLLRPIGRKTTEEEETT
jgi:hypothetical protein